MSDTLEIILTAALVASVIAGLFSLPAIFTVRGTWQRDDRDEPLQLEQRLWFVHGQSPQRWGVHLYAGYLIGPWLLLRRVDSGVQMLMRQGFPLPVAQQVDGTVVARLDLKLTGRGQRLVGLFTPQRIEYFGEPPRVTRRFWEQGRARSYHKHVAPPIK